MFERARGAPASPVSCFGKLPFHPEFLRIALDSPGAALVVRWVERTHAALAKARGATAAAASLSFAAAAPGGRSVLAGVLRESSDGSRAHPVTAFIERPAAGMADRWHLMPLALRSAWTTLAELLQRPFARREDFGAALSGSGAEVELETAGATYAAAASAVVPGPWLRLTAVDDATARHVALNLVAVARAQREARSPDEGIALTMALPPADVAADVAASLWLELLARLVGGGAPATVVLAHDPPRLYAFHRPVDGSDLASLLTAVQDEQVDDLADPWQTLPASGTPLARALDDLVSRDSAPFADLAARIQAVAATA
jgi:type VI secretion system ImpM family protein